MNIITSIHLNGKAYQLEEEGYEALRDYLATAETQLAENPDKTEILADLEQAIAEKCGTFLNAEKDVVTTIEITQIIQEMGPVDGATSGAQAAEPAKPKEETPTPKRLYLVREGAFFAGVCNGLAAYFNLDVSLVRLAFVGLTILTGGAWILVYVAFMFLVPYANTTEERAEAHGEVFNAQEVINRAKESYARLTHHEEWNNWKENGTKYHEKAAAKATAQAAAFRERFESRIHAREARRAARRADQRPLGRSPFLGFLSMVLAILWITALISLIQTGAIFGWMITAYVPLWVAIFLLFIVYHAVTGPMRAVRNHAYATEYAYDGWHGVADGLGVLFLVICAWFAYTHVPEVHAFIDNLPYHIQQLINGIRRK